MKSFDHSKRDTDGILMCPMDAIKLIERIIGDIGLLERGMPKMFACKDTAIFQNEAPKKKMVMGALWKSFKTRCDNSRRGKIFILN